MSADRRFMALALSLGRRGLGRVAPNPAVGCVIVRDGVIVGRGRTADGGRPHAETIALAQAGAAARGADVYVSLEPCAHHGQTSPCAEALAKAGVRRVFVACEDPDDRVAGRGLAILRAAGIEVVDGLCAEEARADHAGFFLSRTGGRPLLTLKLALTLDGRIATATGESRWITGPLARRQVHAMRAAHDAVMVGAGTVRADDPQLDVRGLGPLPQPVRIVVGGASGLPPKARMLAEEGGPVWLANTQTRPPDDWASARHFQVGQNGTAVDVTALMQRLAGAGLTRVFCEGGGQLAATLLIAGLVDRLAVFTAGQAIGSDGLAGLGALALDKLSLAPRFTLQSITPVGGDLLHQWTRHNP